jgi:hypothetical protein
LQQAQESVQPKSLVTKQAKAINGMVRNMAMVMSKSADDGGFGEPITIYARMENGALDTSNMVSIDPSEIKSLDIAVDIKAESSAERITLEQHGMQMLNDPKVQLSMSEFVEDYQGLANPDDVIAKRIADQIFWTDILPPLRKQLVAKWLGTRFVLGPNGQIIGPDGQPASPQQVMAANGMPVPMQPQPMNGQPPPQMGPPRAPQPPGMGGMGPGMPQLPGLQGPPEALPLNGLAG